MAWKVAGEAEQMPIVEGCPVGQPCVGEPTPFQSADGDFVVTLRPMDIRTFVVEFT